MKIIKINEKDNVAIILDSEGVAKNDVITEEIIAMDDILQGHKIALKEIAAGQPVIKYGVAIGYANCDIAKGAHVKESFMNVPQAPDLSTIVPDTSYRPVKARADKMPTFMGYKNRDGSVGTKNLLGIYACVQCAEGVINRAVEKIKSHILKDYPNVDGVFPINHNYGCGVAIDAENAEVPIRTLKNLAKHPNFGGEMIIVSLGCEKLQPEMIFDEGFERDLVILQDEAGFLDMENKILEKAKEKLKILNTRKREKCDISDLVVGLQCGGSDAFSGITANPAVGYAADILVAKGAAVMFSEVSEVRDAAHFLVKRAEDEQVADRIRQEIDWYDNYLKAGTADRTANPSPGNKAGGLANIVEKSMGSVAKSGTSIISDVLSPGQRVKKKGLIFAATPASDFICGTLQAASGITLQVFTTGRGTPYGLELLPVIKVASRLDFNTKWMDLIDVNAGSIALGEKTVQEVGNEIARLIVDVASGREQTKSDILQLYNSLCLFNPAPVT